jgi:hypothetical protein
MSRHPGDGARRFRLGHRGSRTDHLPATRRESGIVGGLEVLPFGLLVFVGGWLLMANAWAVVDVKLAADSAAREAGRTYVETRGSGAVAASDQAAAAALAGRGLDPRRALVRRTGDGARRCSVVTTEVTYRVPAITLPFAGHWADGFVVHGRHRDVVDPFGAGLEGDGDCG